MRDATRDDLAALADLRRSVGWDALDWALLAAVDSPAGRFVVLEDGDGPPVACGSAMVYGPLGFIGNMVVADGHRRRGLGSRVLSTLVDHLRAAGCRRIELFATSDGRQLYGRHGFALSGPSVVATVMRASVSRTGTAEIEPGRTEDLDALAAYDAPRFGGDRHELLARMAADAARPLRIARHHGTISGYAWLRPDGARVGPLLADGPEVAADLVADAFDAMPALDGLRLHMPSGNHEGARWMAGLGATLESWDGRMAIGEPIERRDEAIYANVVGALG
jgi:GNAT superfamily N-acetyltransferase